MLDTPCHVSHLAVTGGCLLALGGLHSGCNLYDATAVAQTITTAVYAYCPATSSWVKIGDLPEKRMYSTIITLSPGELFLTGGGKLDKDIDLSFTDKTFKGTISTDHDAS